MAKLEKALVQALEGSGVKIEAQFNPKELQVDKTVSWTAKNSHKEDPKQEYKEPQSSSLAVTFYFDGYETNTDVRDRFVSKLEKMAKMDNALGRPPLCVFIWGKFKFQGVVESVSMKYTMFSETGNMVRAEVGFKMKSAIAATVSVKKGNSESNAAGG